MLRAGLIDEVSLLLALVADGRTGMAALFDVHDEPGAPQRLQLANVEERADDILWLRYRTPHRLGTLKWRIQHSSRSRHGEVAAGGAT